jgi:hypothetical protein
MPTKPIPPAENKKSTTPEDELEALRHECVLILEEYLDAVNKIAETGQMEYYVPMINTARQALNLFKPDI